MDHKKKLVNLDDWLKYIEQLHSAEIEFGLDRVREVFNRLFPENLSGRVITVGGTNGKGSTCALIERILINNGYSCGKNTSPHINRFNERIVVNGRNVQDSLIIKAFQEVESARSEQSTEVALTYFEFTFLAALLVFEHQKVDFIICEVGLGGRLDAVNILSPEVSIITNISLDHTQWLGGSREEIAMEKVAISRADRPCIIGDENFPQIARSYLQEIKSQSFIANNDYNYILSENSWRLEIENFSINFPHISSEVIQNLPKLDARHQYQNASCAILALLSLNELVLSSQSISTALCSDNIDGRCQIVSQSPVIIVDVAHNVDSIKALNQFVEVKKSQLNYEPNIYAVFSMLDDKDIYACVNVIHHQINEWFIAPLEVNRAATIEKIESTISSVNKECLINSYPSIEAAFNNVKKHCDEEDFILVFGSFYVVGDILRSHQTGHINSKL